MIDDLEQRLHAAVDTIQPSSDLFVDVRRRVHQHRRRPIVGAALVAAAVALVGLVVVPTRHETKRRQVAVGIGPGPTGETPNGSWSPVPATSLLKFKSLGDGAAAWTGSEFLVFDGHFLASYDPGTSSWRGRAASPLTERVAPSVAWTGNELLVWGGLDPGGLPAADGATYNPSTDRWTSLPTAPIDGRRSAIAAVTSAGVVLWGGCRSFNTQCFSPGDGALYGVRGEAKTVDWHTIAPAPLSPVTGATGVGAGSQLVVWSRDGAMAYDPAADAWRRLHPPIADRDGALVASDGRRAFFVGGSRDGNPLTDAVAYDPLTDSWTDIPAGPVAPEAVAWAGQELVYLGADTSAAYDPETRAWRKLPHAPIGPRHNLIIGGSRDALFVFGGMEGDRQLMFDGALYRETVTCPTATELAARAATAPALVEVTQREVPIQGITLDPPPADAAPKVTSDQAWAAARAAMSPDPGPAPRISLAIFTGISSGTRLAWVLVFRDAEVGPPMGNGTLGGQPTVPMKQCYLGTSVMAVDAQTGIAMGLASQG